MANVLLVDDDELVRYALSKAIRKAGHNVIEADNGRTAINIIKREVPDILVTDLIMPDQDGMGVIMELRGIVPSLPIIAISGGGRHVNTDFLPVAKSLGAKATLKKPFDEQELIALIEEFTSG